MKVIIPSELDGDALLRANGEYVPIKEVTARDKRIAELDAMLWRLAAHVTSNDATVDSVRTMANEAMRLRVTDADLEAATVEMDKITQTDEWKKYHPE